VYQKFIAEPKQLKRRMKCLLHKKTFNKPDGVASDSLYKLSLNGSEGKFDLLKLQMYSGTDAGNLALLCWNGILEHW
jgi:hypothetical protein